MRIFFIYLAIAHGGWWSDFCEKNLIAADPEQYSEAPTSWIEYRVYYLDVKRRSGMADKTDLRILKGLNNELKRRKI